MYRIDNATAIAVIPTPAAVGPNPNSFFFKGNPGVGTPATVVDDDWANAVQEEICGVIVAAAITLDKTNRTQLLAAIRALGRTKLTANTTYFVSTTGTDDPQHGTGAGAAAFRTISYALAFLQVNVDLNGFQLTLSVAAGAYNNAISVSGQFIGQISPILLSGTSVTVTLGAGTDAMRVTNGANLTVSGMTLATGAGGSSTCLASVNGATVTVGANMLFGQGGLNGQLYADGGKIYLANSYTVNGGSAVHWFAERGGAIQPSAAITVTLTGTPAFTNAFAVANLCGTISPLSLVSFANTATGSRYTAQFNGCINTGGGGAIYLPGNAVGSALFGGQYN